MPSTIEPPIKKKSVFCSQLEVVQKRVKVSEEDLQYFSKEITTPYMMYNTFRSVFECSPVEIFMVVFLKTNNDILGFEIVSKGTLDQSLAHPREVFKTAIIRNSAKIVLIHNHPSGSLKPSDDDIRLTNLLVEGGKLLYIPILDHLIISENGFVSFQELGLLR